MASTLVQPTTTPRLESSSSNGLFFFQFNHKGTNKTKINLRCVCASVTFVAVTICNIVRLNDARLPYMVVICNCISMSRHLHAFTHPALTVHVGHFTRTGPTERFLLMIGVVISLSLSLSLSSLSLSLSFPSLFFVSVCLFVVVLIVKMAGDHKGLMVDAAVARPRVRLHNGPRSDLHPSNDLLGHSLLSH